MTWTFEITYHGDDDADITLNGEHLININHDDDGWSGMKRISELVKTIAAVFGAEVVEKHINN